MISNTKIITIVILKLLIKTSYQNDKTVIKKADNETGIFQEIQMLETEKGKLFKEINTAIDDSLKTLNDMNDTESKLGIRFFNELKNELKEINETDVNLNDTRRTLGIGDKKDEVLLHHRSSGKMKKRKRKIVLSLAEIASLFNNKKMTKTNSDKYIQQQETMQIKIDEWIKQRKEAKDKIREYKLNQEKVAKFKPEKCKREGMGKIRKKSKGISRKQYYPCCRKCCKKSYMGCL